MNHFFQTKSKGEVFELKRDLNSSYKEKRKETLKRVIQNMTTGKDSSALFPDVAKLIHTEDLELKKLVRLRLKGVFVSDKLCENAAGIGDFSSEYICNGFHAP